MKNNTYLIIIGSILLLGAVCWLLKLLFKSKQQKVQTRLLLGYKLDKPFIGSDRRYSGTITESNCFLNGVSLDKLTRNSKIV